MDMTGVGLLRSFAGVARCSDLKGGSESPEIRVITTKGDPRAELEAPKAPPKEAPAQIPGAPLSIPYSSPQDPLDKYASYIVRGAVIGTGVLGIAIFARSIRLFTRFEHGRQIPEDFVRKGVRLRGKVSTVEPDGSLRVAHEPLMRLPRLFSFRALVPGLLTVRLAGVEVSGAGASFLRQNLGSEFAGNGRRVWFTLINRPTTGGERDAVYAEVTAKLGRVPVWSYNLNQELVRRGLARVPSTDVPEHVALLRAQPAYSRLVNQLLISERIADRRGVGMWQRETWVEGLQALPSQASNILTNSSPWRLLTLLGIGLGSAARTTARVGLWTLKTAPKAASAVGSGTRVVAQTGSEVYHKAKDNGEKAVVVSRGIYNRVSAVYRKVANAIAWVQNRIRPSPKS